MEISLIFILMIIFLFTIHYYLTNRFDVWKKLDIPGPKPILLFGNFKDTFLGKVHLADSIRNIYGQFSSKPVIGVFASAVPLLMLKDLDLIQEVLIKSFSNFDDRGFTTHDDVDPLSQHLLYMTAEKWKPMRKKLLPVFTSARLKEMFYLISACADNFIDYTANLIRENEIVDCCELTCKYAMNVIGVCAFGLETKTFSQEKSEFERVGEMIFESNVRTTVKRLVRNCPHWIAKLINPFIKNDQVVNFFINLMEENMAFRKKHNIRRNDFVDLLMDIKDHPEEIGEKEMSIALLTAQAYVFFVAGFDTSSSTITHALYEMALNPDVQNQLRTEINSTMAKNAGKLSYDTIKSMKYLDQVLKETLRKYPPGYFTGRKAKVNFTFPGTKITVPRGVRVIIPIDAIHNDQNHYPKPDKFDPLRFTKTAEKTRHPMAYIPFGDGPRRCIGDRFALNSIKLGIIKILSRFKFEVCDKTCIPYEKKIGKFLLSPNGGLFLKFTEI